MIPSSTLRQVGGGLDWLVYGMTWEHVSGAKPERRSLQRAKARKASHYIAAHERSSAVGLARLALPGSKPVAKSGRRYTSAGVLFATRRPKGVYVAQLDLQEDGFWLIACHDGEVIPGFDLVLDDAGQVSEAIARLRERHETAQLIDIAQPTLEDVKNNLQARLGLVKTSAQSIPPWMKVVAVALIAYGFYSEGQQWWDEYQAEQDLVQNPAQQFDFTVERAKQLDSWQSGIHLDGPQGLHEALRQIGRIPVGFGGWTLATGATMANGVSAAKNKLDGAIQCVPSQIGWDCTALYSRLPSGTNESFKHFAPGYCTVSWITLDRAQLNCGFSAARNALDRLSVDRTEAFNLGYIPEVQRAMLAFNEVMIDPRIAVPLPNPVVVNQRGDRITLTASGSETEQTHVPGRVAFSFSGPLRSVTLLPLTNSSVIDSISIKRLEMTDPTFISSPLRADVKGGMYVQ